MKSKFYQTAQKRCRHCNAMRCKTMVSFALLITLSFYLEAAFSQSKPVIGLPAAQGTDAVGERMLKHSSLKPSMKEIIESKWERAKSEGAFDIVEVYKNSSKENLLKIPIWEKKLNAITNEFFTPVLNSTSFARGEIEDVKILNGVIEMLQFTILRYRALAVNTASNASSAGSLQPVATQMPPQPSVPAVQALQFFMDDFGKWFIFSADFVYEEASVVGMRLVGVIRSLMLDEIEKFERESKDLKGAEFEKFFNWFHGLRQPWPIDRVILTEGRKVVPAHKGHILSDLARALQRNPYQTSEHLLGIIRGGKAKEADPLKLMWKKEDIANMKTEIARTQKLKLRFALKIYKARQSNDAKDINDLVKQKIIENVPINYESGKPWNLPQVLN